MPARWNRNNRPPSLREFGKRFPDDDACAAYLERRRRPSGFVCPGCGSCSAWKLETKRWTWNCHDCHRQTSVTAGTILHGSKVRCAQGYDNRHLRLARIRCNL